jgi:hypothetical protein
MASLRLTTDKYDRPLVQVEVKPSLLQQQQLYQHPPNTIPSADLIFLVDTGSTHCAINEVRIAAWHLPKVTPKLVLSAQHPTVASYEYDLSLRLHEGVLPDYWLHGSFGVTALPAERFDPSFDGIIGVDLLRLGTLKFDGPLARYELSWV